MGRYKLFISAMDLEINCSLELPALFQYPSKSKKDNESMTVTWMSRRIR